MAFGMNAPAAAVDFADIVKYDANAGRLFRIDYDMTTREKVAVDITTPPPRFAVDFGTIEVGYAHFAASGPEYRLVPEGQPLPPQPMDLDDKNRLKFRSAFRVKLYGKILNGLREWSSAANCVLESVEDLYGRFGAAAEAHAGQIPVVELARTVPVVMGRGAHQRTIYQPLFSIIGWTDRLPDMGPRTVVVPAPAPVAAGAGARLDDEIPFAPCWQ